jgi:hypothetical protein
MVTVHNESVQILKKRGGIRKRNGSIPGNVLIDGGDVLTEPLTVKTIRQLKKEK